MVQSVQSPPTLLGIQAVSLQTFGSSERGSWFLKRGTDVRKVTISWGRRRAGRWSGGRLIGKRKKKHWLGIGWIDYRTPDHEGLKDFQDISWTIPWKKHFGQETLTKIVEAQAHHGLFAGKQKNAKHITTQFHKWKIPWIIHNNITSFCASPIHSQSTPRNPHGRGPFPSKRGLTLRAGSGALDLSVQNGARSLIHSQNGRWSSSVLQNHRFCFHKWGYGTCSSSMFIGFFPITNRPAIGVPSFVKTPTGFWVGTRLRQNMGHFWARSSHVELVVLMKHILLTRWCTQYGSAKLGHIPHNYGYLWYISQTSIHG